MRHLLYEITHRTEYEYLGNVSVSHHLLRLAPRSLARQRCLSQSIQIQPEPAVMTVHGDYFGNRTHFITVERPHRALRIESQSRVAVTLGFIPDPGETPAWESVRALCRGDHSGSALEAHEFTYGTAQVPVDSVYADYASESFLRERPVLEAMLDLTRRIHHDFKFDATATTVSTPVNEVFQRRRGVCQDFAHVQLACLRSLGLPARYVSGYLETDPPPGQPKLRGVDASHAWVAFFCPGLGWIDLDPTNNCLPSLRHIVIGWGRDYSDVAPVRGVMIGGQNQSLSVSVDVAAHGFLDTWESDPAALAAQWDSARPISG